VGALVLAVPDSSDPDHEWCKGFFDPSWWVHRWALPLDRDHVLTDFSMLEVQGRDELDEIRVPHPL
jgi:hypothetical protein